jgi:hypothetical protein
MGSNCVKRETGIEFNKEEQIDSAAIFQSIVNTLLK